MAKIRDKIERLLKLYADLITRFKWFVLISILGVVGLLAYQLQFVTFDTSTEGFFHETDHTLVQYNSFRNQFGRDEMVIIMVESDHIFTLPFLKKLGKFHNTLEENVPMLRDIDSLINARSTRGEDGSLIVEDLLEAFPETEKELEELKTYVLNHPLYKDLLISEGGNATAIVIKTEAFSAFESMSGEQMPLTNEENAAIIKAVESIAKQFQGENFKISIAGSPAVTDFLKRSMQSDMKRFTAMAILIIAILLFLLFRRATGVFLPLLTVIFSVVSTIGIMSIMGVSIKLPTMILPSFLLAIAVGASVHLIAIFFNRYRGDNKNEAITWALSHSGLPIMMTSLTTAAGLASFGTAQLAPIADLGIYSSLGVLFSLFYTLTLIPSLLAILPVKPVIKDSKNNINRIDKILLGCGHISNQHYGKVLLSTVVLFIVATIGIFQLNVSHNLLEWLPKSSIIRKNTELIEKKLKGSTAMEVVLKTKMENGLYNPELLKNIEAITDHAKAYRNKMNQPFAEKTISLADTLKEIHKALNNNDDNFYKIPENEKLIAQEFLLFENSGADDLENQVDSLFNKTRVTFKLPWKDATTYINFIDDTKQFMRSVLNKDIEFVVTGLVVLMMETVHAMINSTIVSYSIAAVVITILMILLIGKFGIGLVSMIPNLFPIFLTLGFMGWFNINLDMFTLLIGSIAIGLAVDDTIHFFHHFRKYYDESNSVKIAIEKTLLTAGRAMLVTTLVLTAGFWIFMAASMNNLFAFGCLTGFTLLMAFLSDVLLAPALLTAIYNNKEK